MTPEYLRLVLECERAHHALYEVAVGLAIADLPRKILDPFRVARLTTPRKLHGCVCGIVAGDILRKYVARVLAQQYAVRVEKETSLFQYTLSTKAGTGCVTHIVPSTI